MITRLSIQVLFIGLLTTQAVQAQKDASAILQLDSTTQGMLPPRMTTTQRDAIATPAQGLVIYNTDTNFYNYWNSTTWIPLSAGGSSTLIDADSDTQIQVEESADEDIIRFDVGGNERTVINNNGLGIKTTPNNTVDLAIGDSDTGLNQVSDGRLALVTNGVQRALIDGNGLGIKTTPATSVDLAIEDTDSGINGSSGRLDFITNGARKLTLTSSQLEVKNATLRLSGDAGRYTLFNAFNSSSNGSFLDINLLNGAGENILRLFRSTSNGVFQILNNSTTVRLRFTSSNGRLEVVDLVETSDIRLKDNIMPLTGVLPKLMQLSDNRYTWRDRPDGGTQIGLLAQEVEAQFPELVHTNTGNGGDLEDTKAVSYTHFTAVLLEGIKELNQKVEALEAANQALEARVAALEQE